MEKNKKQLEKRVENIERELAELRTVVWKNNHEPWWRQIVGQFEGDDAYATIIQLGSELRRADRSE